MDKFTLNWQSTVATHRDLLFSKKITAGHCAQHNSITYAPGEASALLQTNQPPVSFPRHQFNGKQRHLSIDPKVGRFYPQGYAWEALDCARNDFRPFRLIGATADTLTVDTNHPLAAYALSLSAPYEEAQWPDIAALLCANGPGMQAPYPGVSPDFYGAYPFKRADERDDTLFYHTPRLVNHLDKTARAQLMALYGRLLQPGMKILDLMSSHVSHLPDELNELHVTGLGMNQAELAANPRLQQRVVHDLNLSPQLPFADASFDAVICSVSIEYLTQPLAVMQALARVVKTGGKVIMAFSTRWFPNKAISLWMEMHPFERQGLVLDYFLKTAQFSDLHTESVRGLPRPADDPHIRETVLSDPIFAVWGTKSYHASADRYSAFN
ncbi:methyltransferase domain-containing protein [Thiothrix lacustris]|uniref:Methyltransferase domain-containing protein n=1 Tax=Thiothrix lacustris TaxID=525917 RepID=A0ABY9MQ75_9GAMM|nr:methyltransferase domain-containing protein [Thiothrix lacustris]WML90806.1 methyltransferase domain-containing protein [Thiothrix lacustris]